MNLALVFLVLVCLSQSLGLDQTEYDEISGVLNDYFKGANEGGVFIPTVVRLAFHDCVGEGCDGCINTGNSDNAGLSDAINALEAIYTDYSSVLSRADFWAIASLEAIDRAIRIANNNEGCVMPVDPYCVVPALGLTFKWGRVDCDSPDAPETDDLWDFPSPTMTAEEMFEFFNTTFGFNEREVTALMGAHTLGAAARANSGYAGPWIAGEARQFDNRYYSIMTDSTVSWTNLNVAAPNQDPKWQFNGQLSDGTVTSMMLNTDFCLEYELELDATTAQAGCDVGVDCQTSATSSIRQEFADDVELWVSEFAAVFEKMIGHGATLQDL